MSDKPQSMFPAEWMPQYDNNGKVVCYAVPPDFAEAIRALSASRQRGPSRSARNLEIIEKAKRAVASGECASMRAAIEKCSPDEVSYEGNPVYVAVYRAYFRYATKPQKKR
ncbi:hypothetical protein HPO_17480 [Hyphomonas polymorpha PS728]|uniref:Uncharacterized protein n=1 Tax=Hyphomonas polymorpha PS728 TaxID=1280954 RepID=A0A062VC70_9PROT|nr:hypothetical protein [Hyphomonas polymorpha]KCZ96963.1 hypothetical protein HPO_17480 [Hyphomonas polymorpha PS728]